jgi:glutathione peroxidase
MGGMMVKITTVFLVFFMRTCALLAQTVPMPSFDFDNIDGGTHSTDAWRGKPILFVNTASMCAFTPQYEQLQALYDRYNEQGLIVLAIPSDDFNQEMETSAEVKDFCTVNYDITLPMTTISKVRRGKVHPFYAWMKREYDWVPGWNFSKVLIGVNGAVLGTWGPTVKPDNAKIVKLIETELTQ